MNHISTMVYEVLYEVRDTSLMDSDNVHFDIESYLKTGKVLDKKIILYEKNFDQDSVLRQLKINKRKVSLVEAFSYFDEEIDGYVICVDNAMKSDFYQRYRFTLAHELGHILLGHLDTGRMLSRKNSNELWIYEKAEKDANKFAAELLMPKDKVLEQIETNDDINTIEDLAFKFDVSRAAMSIRLEVIASENYI